MGGKIAASLPVRWRSDCAAGAPRFTHHISQRGATQRYSCNRYSCSGSSIWFLLRRAEVYVLWSVVYGLLKPTRRSSPRTRTEPFHRKSGTLAQRWTA